MYDTAMSAIVMIPTEDSSYKYYMSRTKTGMDNMALHADGQLYGASEKMEAISYNTYLTEKMNTVSPRAEQINKADAMIRQMQEALETLASDIREVDKAYTSYKARNFLSFKSSYQSFTDRIDPVSSVFSAGVLLVMAFITMFLREFLKKEKGKEV